MVRKLKIIVSHNYNIIIENIENVLDIKRTNNWKKKLVKITFFKIRDSYYNEISLCMVNVTICFKESSFKKPGNSFLYSDIEHVGN